MFGLLAVVTSSTSWAPGSAATTHPPAPTFRVTGLVNHHLRLTVADLAKMPQITEQVTFQSRNGTETHTETGVLMVDLLAQALPRFNPAVKNDQLRDFVAVDGSDKYEAIVAYGEIDPGFEGKAVILATAEDGVSLASQGPRLVVPGDRKGGRYVTNVVLVRLGSADQVKD
jgi:DMSO/TMAO reductase YedYZ molybdopterin-dependent catalytic subunit